MNDQYAGWLALARVNCIPTNTAVGHSTVATSGERESGLRRLQQAVDAGEPRVIWLKVEPVFDCIRSDGRFQRLLHRLQLD